MTNQTKTPSAMVLLESAAVAIGEYGDSLMGQALRTDGVAMLELEREIRTFLDGPAGQPPAVGGEPDSFVREVFLRNGFTIKEGQTDLKPYVYAAAKQLTAPLLAEIQELRNDGRINSGILNSQNARIAELARYIVKADALLNELGCPLDEVIDLFENQSAPNKPVQS